MLCKLILIFDWSKGYFLLIFTFIKHVWNVGIVLIQNNLELFAKPRPIMSLEHKNKCELQIGNNVKLNLWELHMVIFMKLHVRIDHWMENDLVQRLRFKCDIKYLLFVFWPSYKHSF